MWVLVLRRLLVESERGRRRRDCRDVLCRQRSNRDGQMLWQRRVLLGESEAGCKTKRTQIKGQNTAAARQQGFDVKHGCAWRSTLVRRVVQAS